MKKYLKELTAFIITTIAALQLNGCEKKAESPEQECKTCMARDNIEGVPVKQEEVCSDDAEQSFKSTYSDYSVSCK